MKKDARINIKYLNDTHGLNLNGVYSILEDSHGNLWFGTWGGGVSKYNGKTFTHFKEMQGLSKSIISIVEDGKGNFWFGTVDRGVFMYDGENFTHFSHNEGFVNPTILCMIVDSHDNIWFGTEGGGAARYDGKTIMHFTTKDGLLNNNVPSILEDNMGNIWFGTRGGLSKYGGGTFTHFNNVKGLRDTITSLLEDREGNIWIGTDIGVYKYTGEAFIHFTGKDGFCSYSVSSIYEDSHGNLWFGTVGEGVIKYSGETFTHITENEGLSCRWVNSILEDSQGNMWFGTRSGGVNIYSNIHFTYLNYYEGLSYNYVPSISEDSQGNLWFGTGGGLSKYDNVSFTNFDTGYIITDNWIYSTLVDNQGNLWIGSRDYGLKKYNGETFTLISEKEGLSNNWVWSILEDSHNNLWFGTKGGGVSRYDGATFTHYTEKEGYSNNDIRSIAEDSQKNLWFGTYGGGVIKYYRDTITHISEKEGLSSNVVTCILEDSNGNLWFGTDGGGVSIFNGETFIHITEKEGLSNNSITSILKDNDRNIWIGTRDGLSYLMVGSNDIFKTFHRFSGSSVGEDTSIAAYFKSVIRTYGVQDGLKQKPLAERSVYLDNNNRIWWGNESAGLIMLDMNDFTIPVEPPKLQLDWIEINEQFADYRQLKDSDELAMEFSGVARFYNYPINLELPYNNNHLTFHFSAIDWSAPHKLRYSYKMVGINNNWSSPTEEAIADYRNMPYGTFTFVVRAIGEAQKWSDPFEYTFTINPPWWHSWWVVFIYCLLALSILIAIIRFRERNLKQRALILEQLVEEKTHQIMEQRKEVDDLKSRFYTNISHEFRTPLSLILGPIEDAAKNRSERIELHRDIIGMMYRNARRLKQLINQLLDVSKLESGKVMLQVSEGSLDELVKTIVISYESLAASKHIKFTFDLPETPGIVYFDRDKVEKVLSNLLSNAFKFTSAGGKVHVTLRYDQSEGDPFAEIVVSDTGIGIAAEKLEKIFDRFYQVNDSDTRTEEGTGIGLALTKELVDLYRGEISVESLSGKGSTFRVKIPVSFEQFTEDEIVKVVEDEVIKEKTDLGQVQKEPSDIESSGRTAPGISKDAPIILIVEDNADLIQYISKSLSKNYRILAAVNGKEGLELAQENIPDLVISDVMMPLMDGMEMCAQLKSDDRTSHIPVVMLTARADLNSKLEGLETGADDYMIKPLDAEELKVRVRNLIEQRKRLREKFRNELLSDSVEMELSPGDQLLEKLISLVTRHMAEPEFRMDQLANELNMGRSQMFRKVSAITGYTPHDFILNLRLKKAAGLFRSGHRHVATVMHRVGFNSQSYFASCFKKRYGITPSEYIQSKGS
ncbi:MAG: two-component regulator propeller domain-containing protein [Bacteroidota bacterium]